MIDEQEILTIKHTLAARTEALCAELLPNGRKSGNYWRTGSIQDDKGWSLYVGLQGPFAGEWRDGATEERGDILSLIRIRLGLSFPATIKWSRNYLGISPSSTPHRRPSSRRGATPRPKRTPSGSEPGPNTVEARLLFLRSRPLGDTHAAAYLRSRALTPPPDPSHLRYHPHTYLSKQHPVRFPALIAAITDAQGRFQAIQRTYLDPDKPTKARLRSPRLSLGPMCHGAIRIGRPDDPLIAVGEGLETMLSLRTVLPNLTVAACTSRVILGGWLPSRHHRWVLIAADNGEPGIVAAKALQTRLTKDHPRIDSDIILPIAGDFNDDLRDTGPDLLRDHLLQRIDELRYPSCA